MVLFIEIEPFTKFYKSFLVQLRHGLNSSVFRVCTLYIFNLTLERINQRIHQPRLR